MFAPNQVAAARELLRVCRRKGRIGLANWTPYGFVGRLFTVVGRHVPPPPALSPPSCWGQESYLDHLFHRTPTGIRAKHRGFMFAYGSPEHWLDVFRAFYGRVHKAFANLPPAGQQGLEADLLALVADFNISGDATMVVPADYLEVVVRKR